jgi:hypothetical protein
LGSFEVGIESAGRTPSANKSPSNTRTIDRYGSETSYVWIGGSSGAGGGGGMTSTESSGGFSGSRNSSKKTYNNTTSKSMRDQNSHRSKSVKGQEQIESILKSNILNSQLNVLYNLTKTTRNEYGSLIVQAKSGQNESIYFLDEIVTNNLDWYVDIPYRPTSINYIRIGRVHAHPSGLPFSYSDIWWFSGSAFKEGEFSAVITKEYIFVIEKINQINADENFYDKAKVEFNYNKILGKDKSLNNYIRTLDKLLNSGNSGFKFYYFKR